jgi:negative elongation factor B
VVTPGQIYECDPCHTLAWCLDACVRDNSIGPKRLQEMQLFFDYVPETDAIWPDLAMIVLSPFTTNMLLRNVISLLQKVPGSKTKPKVTF